MIKHHIALLVTIELALITIGCSGQATKSPIATPTTKTLSQLPEPTQTRIAHKEYTCTDIAQDIMSDANLTQMTSAYALVSWLQSQPRFQGYYISSQKESDFTSVSFNNPALYYYVDFGDSGFHSLEMGWRRDYIAISFSQIFACYGQPVYYEAYNLPPVEDVQAQFLMSVWYPEQGLVFRHASSPARKSGNTPASLKIFKSDFCHPGSIEQAIRNCYAAAIKNETYFVKYQKSVRVWPGSMDKVEVDREELVR